MNHDSQSIEKLESLDGLKDDFINQTCSSSDSIDTLELLKQSTEIINSNRLNENQTENDNKIDDNDEEISELESERLSRRSEEIDSVIETSESNKITENTQTAAIEYKTHFSYGFDDDEIKTDDLNHLEPKLREAWIEMRRLDKVLKRVSDKEKRVKLETKSLIEKYRVELDLIKMTSDRKESKQEEENTANFMALSYLDNRIEDDENYDNKTESQNTERESMTPLFKTQPEGFEQELDDLNNDTKTNKKSTRSQSLASSITNKDSLKESITPTKASSRQKSKLNGKTTSISGFNSKKNEKNFIKRNIQLAQDAGGALAMTDDEKKRLDELLVDVDKEDDKEFVVEYDEKTQTHNQIVDYNPLEIKIAAGDGFQPNLNDQQRLNEIESRLETRNYSRILTGGRNTGLNSATTFTNSSRSISTIDPELYRNIMSVEQKKIKLNDEFDENEFGDKFIREARISREQQTRLKYIDTQLETIRTPSQVGIDQNDISSQRTSSSNISLISNDQLQTLLDECSLSNKSVVSIIHNHKLGTLIEEENDQVEDLGAINELIDENNENEINENTIRTLLQEAKNEGIVPIQMDEEIKNDTNEPSFYEQALEVLKDKSKLLKTINIEAYVDNDNNLNEINEDKNIKLPEIKATDENKQKLRRQTESANVLGSRISSASSNFNEDNEILRSSSSVSLKDTSNTQPFLPRIDSRFLPSNTK